MGVPRLEREITVHTPIDRVWAFLTDFTTTEQWDPPTQSTTLISGDGGVGSVYRNVSKIFGRETKIEYTVTDVEPKSLFRLEGRTDSMTMLDSMTFESAPTGETTIGYTVDFTPKGAAKLLEPLMPLGLKRLGDDAAEQMRSVLEQL